MEKKCPKCRSMHVEMDEYIGLSCIVCMDCGYDERSEYDIAPEENSSQGLKEKYSPYKTGGSKRTQK